VENPGGPEISLRIPKSLENVNANAPSQFAPDATRWGPFFRLALGCAARRGELLALRWDDAMLPEVGQATLTVRRAFVEGKGKDSRIVEKGTKTDRVRTIPLGALGIEALRSQWASQAQERREAGGAYADTGHVFQRLTCSL
jgi:integrase